MQQKNITFLIFIFLIGGLAKCNPEDKKAQIFQLKPPLHTHIHYSISRSHSEPDRNNRSGFDSTSFTVVFVDKEDSILSCKLYLKYLGTRFSNGLMVSTSDSIRNMNWGKDYMQAIAFLQKQVITDSFWIVMLTNGTILRVEGFDSMVNRLSSRFDIDKRTVRGLLNERVGNEAIKDMLSQLFFYLPGKPVKKNDNWIRNVMVTVKAPMKYSNFIKVREIHDDTMFLDVQSAITARTGEGGVIYEEGKRTFEIRVSQSTGLPIEWSGIEQTIYTAQGSSVRKKVITKGRWNN